MADIRWSRTDEHLLEIMERQGARERDINLYTVRRDHVPYRDQLNDTWEHARRADRFPVVWIEHETTGGVIQPLIISHMRTWACVQPVQSMVQFMQRWLVVDHKWGSTHELCQEWERTQQEAKVAKKKWAVYGVREHARSKDGICITDSSWYLASRDNVERRERRLQKEDGDLFGDELLDD